MATETNDATRDFGAPPAEITLSFAEFNALKVVERAEMQVDVLYHMFSWARRGRPGIGFKAFEDMPTTELKEVGAQLDSLLDFVKSQRREVTSLISDKMPF